MESHFMQHDTHITHFHSCQYIIHDNIFHVRTVTLYEKNNYYVVHTLSIHILSFLKEDNRLKIRKKINFSFFFVK